MSDRNSRFSGFTDSMENLRNYKSVYPNSNQNSGFRNGSKLGENPLDMNTRDSPLVLPDPINGSSTQEWSEISEGDTSSPSYDIDFSESVLKYISEVLMEEDMGEQPCMFHDALALQAAEKSLYEVLEDKSPSSPYQPRANGDQNDQNVHSRNGCCSGDFSDNSQYTVSASMPSTSLDSRWNGDLVELTDSWLQNPIPSNFVFQSVSKFGLQSSVNSSRSINGNGLEISRPVVPDFFQEKESMLQFNRGVEEASKFLPKQEHLVIGLENYSYSSETELKKKTVVKSEKERLCDCLTIKKSHEREEEEDLEEERSKKQSALYIDDSDLSEMLNKVLLDNPPVCILHDTSLHEDSKTLKQNGHGTRNRPSRGKPRSKKSESKDEVVDLRSLLIQCAQAVSVNDHRTANELLKRIRKHSSPSGDGSERLAHYFANSLEARLSGTGTQIYTTLSSKRTAASDMLKAYQVYLSSCPFKKIAIIFANHNILALAEKATTLHIIDFGISYGFQWPGLIQRLSMRQGGRPKLRITGIELPQRGFRPAEGVQATGRRLGLCCKCFNVPFEYNAIAQKWETIRIEDLNLNPNETVAVNCLARFKNLLDETVMVNSPRDTVLNLIRKINPNIFIQAIRNGSYNSPFFSTRFREALFHFSSMFDIFDANLPRDDKMRLMFEKEFYGREIVNVTACEGTGRVERPEPYKQWSVRNKRAGFRQVPLDRNMFQRLRNKAKVGYHSDFLVDEDSNWLLQGWKGRIVFASSAWVPA